MMYGATTFSYYEQNLLQNNYQYNWQNFWVMSQGSWSKNVSWSWSPNESQDTQNSATWEMPLGTLNYDKNGNPIGTPDTPEAKSLSLTWTDNADGATCTSNYYLTMHDQWDNWTPDTPSPRPWAPAQYYCMRLPNGTAYAFQNPQPTSTPANEWPNGSWNFTLSGTATIGFALTAGFTLFDLVQFQPNFTASAAFTFAAGVIGQSGQVPPQMQTYPYACVKYPMDTSLVSIWTPAGPYGAGQYPQTYGNMHDGNTGVGWSAFVLIGNPPPFSPLN